MLRVMSLLMFCSTGLIPVSQAISGAVSKWDLDVLSVSAGTLVLLATVWMSSRPGLKALSESLAAERVEKGGLRMDRVTS